MGLRSSIHCLRVFSAGLILSAAASTAQATGGANREAQSPLNPEEWATRALGRCLEEEERWQQSLEDLRAHLKSAAQSKDQQDFPGKEEDAREKWLRTQRGKHFARLKFLLHGKKAVFLEQPAERFRGAVRPPGSYKAEPFQKTLQLLFGDATPCGFAALESTLFSAIFDQPFSRERLERGLGTEQLFSELDEAYHHQIEHSGSVEGAYRSLRPSEPANAFPYISELVARLAGIAAAHVTRARVLTTQEQLQTDREGALQNPRASPLFRGMAEGEAELWALAARLEEFVRLAAEPIRIQTYLHSKVEELEGAFRVNIPDKTAEKLFRNAEEKLFPDAQAMRRLASRTPDEVLGLLEPILDRWFQREALPAVQKALHEDPFSAYWFYVQTGMVARGNYTCKASRVLLEPAPFALEHLKGLKFHEAINRLRVERIPDEFLDFHTSLEEALTRTTLTRQETLRRIEDSEMRQKERASLAGYAENLKESDVLSTTDVFTWIVRDASKIEGSVDRDGVRAAMETLHAAKREKLRAEIQASVDALQSGEAERLARYLQNAGSLLLELELNQTSHGRFQENAGGFFVGWILKQFLIGDGFPIQLWVPDGVTGEEFAGLLDELTQKNKQSANDYSAKGASEVTLIVDGEAYREATLEVINGARNFLNISQFSWKLDQGGKEMAYRLMGKKLGLEGPRFEGFLEFFRAGLPLKPGDARPVLLYDIPANKVKNLLFYYFFTNTPNPEVAAVRHQLEAALGDKLACASVENCGDLSPLIRQTGTKYRPEGVTEPSYGQAWEAHRQLQGLFEEELPVSQKVRPRVSLADHIADGSRLRRFVRRHGRKRGDDPGEPFPINIFSDGKDNFVTKRLFKRSPAFPYLYQDTLRDLYYPLMEFDVRVMLWKGLVMEIPWHIGPIPLPGRKIFGVFPIPFVPYPWLNRVFSGLGPKTALFLQWALASDVRNWWAMANHTKHISSEDVAIESGMGYGSKYFNAYPGFKTWHDAGIKMRGPIVGDTNDAYVQMFNEVRVNNAGIPGARGAKIPKLDYEDYRYQGKDTSENRSWVITTNPELQDYNYRGVLMAALAAARKNIYIENFFISDPLVARMLIRKAKEFRGRAKCAGLTESGCSAAKRDAVEIYVVLPDESDQPNADLMSTLHRHELLHLGVKFYKWNPPAGWSAKKMLHTKVWMVDYEEGKPALTYVGTANLSQRSHLTDNEMGIVSTSPSLAQQVRDYMVDPNTTTDSQGENPETFHIVLSSNRAVRAARWLQFFLVGLTWAF